MEGGGPPSLSGLMVLLISLLLSVTTPLLASATPILMQSMPSPSKRLPCSQSKLTSSYLSKYNSQANEFMLSMRISSWLMTPADTVLLLADMISRALAETLSRSSQAWVLPPKTETPITICSKTVHWLTGPDGTSYATAVTLLAHMGVTSTIKV